ncbi:hypothetical protein IC582_030636 [Cucumis melo]
MDSQEERKRLDCQERSEATRLRLGRFRAKVLYEKNIGEERSHSTEVRKERSEGTRSLKYRRGAVEL